MLENFEAAFEEVKGLAADFKAGEKHFLSPAYQEQEARHDFIDKFWMALGWDVNHNTQKNPYEQEVKVERKEHGSSQRRADYAFYIGPNFRDVKFYVEAKKPFGDIATADNYFQAIRYGWNSQNPIAVLHDFEQFEIADCRYKPDIATALSQSVRKFHYSEYSDKEKFGEIYWLFSREAVAAGSIEKFTETLPKRRGKAVQRGLFKGGGQGIDETFLEELDAYREELARGFKNKNPELDGETLTELTQRTLDRLVFLRFLEDKQIESQNRIAYYGDKGTAWQDFVADSRRLNGIYNGIVFKEHPLLDKSSFKVDDDVFGDICEKLSHINSPYDFNAIPIHILGSIYERFLGKVITTTDKRARVEEKPEVRKAGGVYYTPEYIVRYIVENTVGKLIAGKSPAQIAEMKFADIACGSGSFLLGVYDLLIRYHTKYYNENPGKAKKNDVAERDDGLHLTLQKKREILLNNIFGVDIDHQAVEVAQLSLYLKLLQDETPGSARAHQLEFHETLLPTLNKNITCGNSLIGTDILAGQLFASDEEKKLNPMDFEQRFPQIFRRGSGEQALRESSTPLDLDMPGVPLHGKFDYKKKKAAKVAPPITSEIQGGFDAIVGNPPYGAELTETASTYLRTNFSTANKDLDTYSLFIEQAIKITRPGGKISMIVPTGWYSGAKFPALRRFIARTTNPECFINLPYDVFADAWVDTTVFVVEKRDYPTGWPRAEKCSLKIRTFPKKHRILRSEELSESTQTAEMTEWFDGNSDVFLTYANSSETRVVQKIRNAGKAFSEFADIQRGVTPFVLTEKPTHKTSLRAFEGTIRRYLYQPGNERYIRFDDTLAEPKPEKYFRGPRLLLRELISRDFELQAMKVEDNFVTNKSMQSILAVENGPRLEYLLSILNSRLMSWYFLRLSNIAQRDDFPKIVLKETRSLPIRPIEMNNPSDKTRYDRIVSLVEQMLSAKKQLATAQSEKDKDFYTNRCDGLDRQIDALVYELYGLTTDEIKIVEGGNA